MNNPQDSNFEFSEVLDEEFQRYVDLIKMLMSEIRRSSDREIISRYIKRCLSLSEVNIHTKTNRNEFLKFFLKMIYIAVDNQPPFYENPTDPPVNKVEGEVIKHWSNDKRTYVSVKVIKGVGTLIYMAVNDKPEQGWVKNGFLNYNF